MEDLKKRLDRMERNLEKYLEMGSIRARELEQRIATLERLGEGRDERISNHAREVAMLGKHIDRMETTLLNEFKISQDIMKSMLDHEWAIDQAKLELKLELERKEAELLNEQKNLEMQMKAERVAFRREMYIKAGTIGLPILTALATGISFIIQGFFK